jgi:LuxR family maltose regulon positive regulatory protein
MATQRRTARKGRKQRFQRQRPEATHLPAKVVRPRVRDAVARPRLYRALDRLTRNPVTWIHAPAGAGKTTLLSTYLERRRTRVLWYDVDGGDVDPGGVYHYARLGAEALAGRALELPAPVPGPPAAQRIFARRFFEALFAQLPTGALLVFDNYQEAVSGPAWSATFRELCAAITPRVRVVVASRLAPPPALARLAANGDLQVLNWHDLRLQEDEIRLLLRRGARGGGKTTPDSSTLMALTDGWAVAVALLARSRTGVVLSRPAGQPEADDLETVFHFLATEIVDRLEPAARALLDAVALLPSFSANMAAELTGHPQAPALLMELYRDHLLLERQGDSDFRLHDLFRRFLHDRSRRTARDENDWNALSVRAARLLARHDQFPSAVELLVESTNWPALVDLIEEHAHALAVQGRLATLANAIAQLPLQVPRRAWLAYWQAVCTLGRQGGGALPLAETAFQDFRRTNDSAGMLLSWSLVVHAIVLAGDDFRPLERWLNTLEEADLVPPNGAVAVKLAHAKVLAAFFWETGTPHSLAIADWAVDTVRSHGTREDRILVGGAAAFLYHVAGQTERARDLQRSTRREAVAIADPATGIAHRHFEALVEFQTANFEAAKSAIEDGLATARASGIDAWNSNLLGMAAFNAIVRGDLAEADRHLRAIDAELSSGTAMGRGLASFVRGWLAFERNEIEEAIRWNDESIRAGERLGFLLGTVQSSIADVVYRAALSSQAEVAQAIDRVIQRSARVPSDFLAPSLALARAFASLCLGEDGREALRAAMIKARQGGFILPSPRVIYRLVTAALEHDIEPQFACALLRAYALRPGPGALTLAAWPWPVKIRVLGPVVIEIGGRALRFGRKPPLVPLALLKVLAVVADPISIARLTNALWPGYGDDAPRSTLDMALHRLRKLLGTDASIEIDNGYLRLSDSTCWTDVRALALVCDHITDLASPNVAPPDLTTVEGCQRTLLDLYRGPLGDEDDPLPVIRGRALARRRFARAIAELGGLWLRLGERARAEDLRQLAAGRDEQGLAPETSHA